MNNKEGKDSNPNISYRPLEGILCHPVIPSLNPHPSPTPLTTRSIVNAKRARISTVLPMKPPPPINNQNRKFSKRILSVKIGTIIEAPHIEVKPIKKVTHKRKIDPVVIIEAAHEKIRPETNESLHALLNPARNKENFRKINRRPKIDAGATEKKEMTESEIIDTEKKHQEVMDYMAKTKAAAKIKTASKAKREIDQLNARKTAMHNLEIQRKLILNKTLVKKNAEIDTADEAPKYLKRKSVGSGIFAPLFEFEELRDEIVLDLAEAPIGNNFTLDPLFMASMQGQDVTAVANEVPSIQIKTNETSDSYFQNLSALKSVSRDSINFVTPAPIETVIEPISPKCSSTGDLAFISSQISDENGVSSRNDENMDIKLEKLVNIMDQIMKTVGSKMKQLENIESDYSSNDNSESIEDISVILDDKSISAIVENNAGDALKLFYDSPQTSFIVDQLIKKHSQTIRPLTADRMREPDFNEYRIDLGKRLNKVNDGMRMIDLYSKKLSGSVNDSHLHLLDNEVEIIEPASDLKPTASLESANDCSNECQTTEEKLSDAVLEYPNPAANSTVDQELALELKKLATVIITTDNITSQMGLIKTVINQESEFKNLETAICASTNITPQNRLVMESRHLLSIFAQEDFPQLLDSLGNNTSLCKVETQNVLDKMEDVISVIDPSKSDSANYDVQTVSCNGICSALLPEAAEISTLKYSDSFENLSSISSIQGYISDAPLAHTDSASISSIVEDLTLPSNFVLESNDFRNSKYEDNMEENIEVSFVKDKVTLLQLENQIDDEIYEEDFDALDSECQEIHEDLIDVSGSDSISSFRESVSDIISPEILELRNLQNQTKQSSEADLSQLETSVLQDNGSDLGNLGVPVVAPFEPSVNYGTNKCPNTKPRTEERRANTNLRTAIPFKFPLRNLTRLQTSALANEIENTLIYRDFRKLKSGRKSLELIALIERSLSSQSSPKERAVKLQNEQSKIKASLRLDIEGFNDRKAARGKEAKISSELLRFRNIEPKRIVNRVLYTETSLQNDTDSISTDVDSVSSKSFAHDDSCEEDSSSISDVVVIPAREYFSKRDQNATKIVIHKLMQPNISFQLREVQRRFNIEKTMFRNELNGGFSSRNRDPKQSKIPIRVFIDPAPKLHVSKISDPSVIPIKVAIISDKVAKRYSDQVIDTLTELLLKAIWISSIDATIELQVAPFIIKKQADMTNPVTSAAKQSVKEIEKDIIEVTLVPQIMPAASTSKLTLQKRPKPAALCLSAISLKSDEAPLKTLEVIVDLPPDLKVMPISKIIEKVTASTVECLRLNLPDESYSAPPQLMGILITRENESQVSLETRKMIANIIQESIGAQFRAPETDCLEDMINRTLNPISAVNIIAEVKRSLDKSIRYSDLHGDDLEPLINSESFAEEGNFLKLGPMIAAIRLELVDIIWKEILVDSLKSVKEVYEF